MDSVGGIYVAGYFNNTIDFDSGSATFALAPAGYDGFIWKLDTHGNFGWAVQVGGVSSGDSARAINVDRSGNIFVGGDFADTVDFDPGTGTHNLTSNGGRDFFLLKLTQTSALASSASSSHSTNSLLATEPADRKRRATLECAFASLSLENANTWDNSLDEELLLCWLSRRPEHL